MQPNGMLNHNSNSQEEKMAKHYKQSRKDRMHESRGMKRYENHRNHNSERHQDSLMMPKDAANNQEGNMYEHTQMYHMGRDYYGPGYGHQSNLPPKPDLKLYPREKKYLRTGDYPDTIREIDYDGEDNMDNLNSQPSNSMY